MEKNKRNYSDAIANAIEYFLRSDDWNYTFNEEKGSFKFGLRMNGQIKIINYRIFVREDNYTVYVACPIGVDPKNANMIARMAEFVCRINLDLRHGNFELDMDEGDIRYKCHIDCKDITLSEAIVKNSIYLPSCMFEQYIPGLFKVIFSNNNVKDIVDQCENAILDEIEELSALLEEVSDDLGTSLK